MKVSCIVLNWNLKYLSRLCIEALQRSKTDFRFEIVVVDNDSHDESLEYLKERHAKGEITLVHAGANLGYGKGNNLGVKHAKGEYVVILNPDVSVEEDTLQKLLDYFEKHDDIGILAPQLYFFNGQIQDSCRRFMRPEDLIIKRTPLRSVPAFKKRVHRYLMNDYNHQDIQDVDLITGACFMIRRNFFQDLGGFDPRYFLFMEDVDLCRRVWEAGKRVVYFPQARALHYHKRLSDGGFFHLLFKRIFWIHLTSMGKYFWKWRGRKLPR